MKHQPRIARTISLLGAVTALTAACGDSGPGGTPRALSGTDPYEPGASGQPASGAQPSPLTPDSSPKTGGPGNDVSPGGGSFNPDSAQGTGGTTQSGAGGAPQGGGGSGQSGSGQSGSKQGNPGGSSGGGCEAACVTTLTACPQQGVTANDCPALCKSAGAACKSCVLGAGTDCPKVSGCISTVCTAGGPGGSPGQGPGGAGGSGVSGSSSGGDCASSCQQVSAMCPMQLPASQCGAFCSAASATCQSCVFSSAPSGCAQAQQACASVCKVSSPMGGGGSSASGGGCAALGACCNPMYQQLCDTYIMMANDSVCDQAAKAYCMLPGAAPI